MSAIRLIHPIYLDVPMLVSFAAAIQGGLSLSTEVTREAEESKKRSTNLNAKLGLSELLGSFFNASVDGGLSGEKAENSREIQKETKAHTEASTAILLYDHLLENGEYILHPKNAEDLLEAESGMLVEISGVLFKNAIDSMIDYLDIVNILSALDNPKQPSKKKTSPKNELEIFRDTLSLDRERTPISNALLRCSEPDGIDAVITLRTENLRDLTLAELHKNNVHIVGKVTRVTPKGEKMSAFENYGLSLIVPEVLTKSFNEVTSSEGIVAEFSDVVVTGPAVQILPLMIYV